VSGHRRLSSARSSGTYRQAVRWVAESEDADDLAQFEYIDEEEVITDVSGLLTVMLVAHLFLVEPLDVARDVITDFKSVRWKTPYERESS